MTPILTQILFKPLPSPERTESGLFIPENAREVNNKGTIVSVGRGTAKQPMRLKKGMIAHRVLNWGEPLYINNEIHFLMDQQAILSIDK